MVHSPIPNITFFRALTALPIGAQDGIAFLYFPSFLNFAHHQVFYPNKHSNREIIPTHVLKYSRGIEYLLGHSAKLEKQGTE